MSSGALAPVLALLGTRESGESLSKSPTSVPVDDSSRSSAALEALKTLTDEEKWVKAYDLKMQGIPVQTIAGIFGVKSPTIHGWLRKHTQVFRGRLEVETAADLVSESLQTLDEIKRMCLYEASQVSAEAARFDAKTGEVVRNKAPKGAITKLKCYETVLKAEEMRVKLLQDVGVIPKEAERIYHTMADQKTTVGDAVSSVEAARTADDISENIVKLVAQGRRV
jgi:transposase-like protein